MVTIISLVIPILTLCLYLTGTFGGWNKVTTTIAILTGALITWIIKTQKGNLKQKDRYLLPFLKEHILAIFTIAVVIFSVLVILSPLVVLKNDNGRERLRFPGIGDYYKHSYTLTAINQSGLPPNHPYFPPATFSYYYGYYLIPAAIAKLFSLSQTTVFFMYVLLTTTFSLSLIYWIICQVIVKPLKRFLALSLIIFGASFDIIPTIFSSNYKFPMYMELWSQKAGLDFIVNNTYTAFLWAPQHFLAGVLTVFVFFQLVKGKMKLFPLVLIYAYVALSSIFVALTLVLWSVMLFVFWPKLRGQIFKIGFIVAILLMPFVLQLSGRSNLLSLYNFTPLQVVQISILPLEWFINTLLTLFFEYGPLFFLLPVVFLITKLDNSKKLLLFGCYLSAILTWFIKSPGFNDFAMRTVLPAQLIIPISFVVVIDKIKKDLARKVLYSTIILILMISSYGFVNEFYGRWKDRTVFDAEVSQMLLKMRGDSSDTSFAAVEKDEWVFLMPTLGFKEVLNPSLHDSGVYMVGEIGNDHRVYEEMGGRIFYEQDYGVDNRQLINRRNNSFDLIKKYFSIYSFDQLILNNRIWVKKGKNSWVEVFRQIGVTTQNYTGSYTLINRDSLLYRLNVVKPYIEENSGIGVNIEGRYVFIKGGLWYVTACEGDNQSKIDLEFEDYFTLLSYDFSGSTDKCVGKMFYLPQDENLFLGLKTNVKKIYLYPIVIVDSNQ